MLKLKTMKNIISESWNAIHLDILLWCLHLSCGLRNKKYDVQLVAGKPITVSRQQNGIKQFSRLYWPPTPYANSLFRLYGKQSSGIRNQPDPSGANAVTTIAQHTFAITE
jgi:hypothetical protein